MKSRVFPLFAALLLMLFSLGLRAQSSEPSVQQIYQTASSGDLAGARRMIDEVVAAHPKSAKAHFVKAELSARANDAATARTELQAAEALAPGLPFVRPEAASALRTQVERMSSTASAAPAAQPPLDTGRMGAPPATETSTAPQRSESPAGFSFFPLLLIGVPLAFFFLRRRRGADTPYQGPAGYHAGPAPGRDNMVYDRYGNPVVPPNAGYGPAGMGYPTQGGGMGSAIARGLGTGLAVGAGAVAAQEIGRRMFEHGHEQGHNNLGDGSFGSGSAANSQLARDAGLGGLDPSGNADMGGQDFGLLGDTGWDDGGGFGDAGGGSDWDN